MHNARGITFDMVSKTMYLLPKDGRLLPGMVKNLWKTGRPLEARQVLTDISFTLAEGKAVGVIGENGAGKTTLLRLAGGVMNPSSGKITVSGRTAPLIDLAAGFVREFSGWENIRINAALLGMSSGQIRTKLDEIVDFCGLEEMLDQPLKIYSAGMVLRLGFAVAAMSDPEILLVDEVLAVGDYRFFSKCLEKVRRLKESGTAIIFVSHDLHQVGQLCEEGLWLQGGRLRAAGPVQDVVRDYRAEVSAAPRLDLREAPENPRWVTGWISITRVEIVEKPFAVKIHYRAGRQVLSPSFLLTMHRREEGPAGDIAPKTARISIPAIAAGEEGWVAYSAEEIPLPPGNYLLSASVYGRDGAAPLDHHDRQYPFRIAETQEREDLAPKRASSKSLMA